MSKILGYYRYVPYHRVADYLDIGWMVVLCRPHMHMDQYRVPLWWPCECKLAEPVR